MLIVVSSYFWRIVKNCFCLNFFRCFYFTLLVTKYSFVKKNFFTRQISVFLKSKEYREFWVKKKELILFTKKKKHFSFYTHCYQLKLNHCIFGTQRHLWLQKNIKIYVIFFFCDWKCTKIAFYYSRTNLWYLTSSFFKNVFVKKINITIKLYKKIIVKNNIILLFIAEEKCNKINNVY